MTLNKQDYCYYKTKFCMYEDACDKKDKCQFAHSKNELEPIKCYYDYTNECYNEECYFWHKSIETIKEYKLRMPKVNIRKPFYKLNSTIIEKQQNNIFISTNDNDEIIKQKSNEKINIILEENKNKDDYTLEVYNNSQQIPIYINQINDIEYSILKIKLNIESINDFFTKIKTIDDKVLKIEKIDNYYFLEVYIYRQNIEVYKDYIFNKKEQENFNLPI